MEDNGLFPMEEMSEDMAQQPETEDEITDPSHMFNDLCSGILTSLHLVESAVDELLSLKDELLKHALPPVVLSRIAVSMTKVFRSVSDCWVPAKELTRLVQLYSMPLEEKNKSIKKLYKNFDSKKSQLCIAIRRLQLLDAKCQWLEQQNRTKTWERMFLRIMSSRGHRKRWKFLTAWFKKKAEEGPRSVRRFVKEMSRVVDSEKEEEDEEEDPADEYKLIREMIPREPLRLEETEMLQRRVKKEEGRHSEDQDEDSQKDWEIERTERTSMSRHDDVKSRMSSLITRPVMLDKQMWTHEPEFDHYLCVRVLRPEELGQQDLICCVQLGDQNITMEFRRSSGATKPHLPTTRVLRGRGLIGSKNLMTDDSAGLSLDARVPQSQQLGYEDCVFCVTEELLSGMKSTSVQLNFEVYSGRTDRLLAKATVDMDDLRTMDLQTMVISSSEANDPLNLSSVVSKEPTALLPVNPLKHSQGKIIPRIELSDQFGSAKATMFPLFEVGESTAASHGVCGYLPLLCLWAQQEKPRSINRLTESECLNEIVYDLTGLDLTRVRKEDLNKETKDQGTSPMDSAALDAVTLPDTVPRAEYEKVLRGHVEEIDILRTDYEMRLREMADSLQEMEEAHADMQRLIQTNAEGSLNSMSDTRPRSRSGNRLLLLDKDSRSLSKLEVYNKERMPQPPKDGRSPPQPLTMSGTRLTKSATNPGGSIPENSYERMKHLDSRSQRHAEELAEKRRQEAIYRLSSETLEVCSLQDLSLPAVFMPTKIRDLSRSSSRGRQSFHATGAHGIRLASSASLLDLPPISNSTIPVINLFEVSQNFHPTSGSGSWLFQRISRPPEGSDPAAGKTMTTGPVLMEVVDPVDPQNLVASDLSQQSDIKEEA